MNPDERDDSPYVFRDEVASNLDAEITSDQDTIIVDGRTMRFRSYRVDRENE